MAHKRPQYWAFISYSSKDQRWGNWLRKRLENYQIPRDLRGREVFPGVKLERHIRPVFQDRMELAGGADLPTALRNALENSRFLVVLCSKNSARSEWVNREVEIFRELGYGDRILTLILDGDPNASKSPSIDHPDECLPPALRFPHNPLSGDLRKRGDGKERGLLKILSAICRVEFDLLYQRHQRAFRRRMVGYTALVASLLVLMIGLARQASAKSLQAVQVTEQLVQVERERSASLDAAVEAQHNASRAQHNAAMNAMATGDRRRSLASLAHALRLWEDNRPSQQAAIGATFLAQSPYTLKYCWRVGGNVSDFEILPDGHTVVASSWSTVSAEVGVCAFDLQTGNTLWQTGISSGVEEIDIAEDGRSVLAISFSFRNQRYFILDTANGDVLNQGDYKKGETLATPGFVDYSFIDSTTRMKIESTGSSVYESGYARSDKLDMDFYSTGAGKVLGINRQNPELTWEIDLRTDSRLSTGREILVSPDNVFLYIMTTDGSVEVLQARDGKKIKRLTIGASSTAGALSADGLWLAVGSGDGIVHLIDTISLEMTWSYQSRRDVSKIQFATDGKFLLIGTGRSQSGDDSEIEVLELAPSLSWAYPFSGGVGDSFISSDSKRVFAGGTDTSIRCYDIDTGALLWFQITGFTSIIECSSDGRLLAVACSDGQLSVLDAKSGTPLWTQKIEELIGIKFVGDGTRLAIESKAAGVSLLDSTSGDLVRSFAGAGAYFRVGVDPSELFVMRSAGVLEKHDPRDGETLATFQVDPLLKKVVLVGLNGKVLLSEDKEDASFAGKRLVMYDTLSGKVLWESSPRSHALAIRLSPDGKQIAFGTWDKSVQLIDGDSGQLIWTSEIGSSVTCLDFSPDGSLIAVGATTKYGGGGSGNSLLLFDANSGTRLWQDEWNRSVFCVTISDDNSKLAVGFRGTYNKEIFLKIYEISSLYNDDQGSVEDLLNYLDCQATVMIDSMGNEVDLTNAEFTEKRQALAQSRKTSKAGSLQSLTAWRQLEPASRPKFPSGNTKVRQEVTRRFLDRLNLVYAKDYYLAMPWHPLAPASMGMAGVDKLSAERVSYLLNLSFSRLQALDPEEWDDTDVVRMACSLRLWARIAQEDDLCMRLSEFMSGYPQNSLAVAEYEAIDLYMKGNFAEAKAKWIEILRLYIQASDDQTRIRLEILACDVGLKDYDTALNGLQILAAKPGVVTSRNILSARFHAIFGMVCVDTQNYEDGAENLAVSEKIFSELPTDLVPYWQTVETKVQVYVCLRLWADAENIEGVKFYQAADFEAAIVHYRRSLEIHDALSDSRTSNTAARLTQANLGAALRESGKLAEAKTVLQGVMQAWNASEHQEFFSAARAAYHLALTEERLGNRDEAERWLQYSQAEYDKISDPDAAASRMQEETATALRRVQAKSEP